MENTINWLNWLINWLINCGFSAHQQLMVISATVCITVERRKMSKFGRHLPFNVLNVYGEWCLHQVGGHGRRALRMNSHCNVMFEMY